MDAMRWSAHRRRLRSWADDFKAAPVARFDEAYALKLFATYAQAFRAAYTEDFSVTSAAFDVTFLEPRITSVTGCTWMCTARAAAQGQILSQDLPQLEEAIPISDLLPMLENRDSRCGRTAVWARVRRRPRALIQDLELKHSGRPPSQSSRCSRRDQERVHGRMDRLMDSDSFTGP